MPTVISSVAERFARLGIDAAPGQESAARADIQRLEGLRRGDDLAGVPVDFSHGDVNAFAPIPSAIEHFNAGVTEGAHQAYTTYKGRAEILNELAGKLGEFTGTPVDPASELIITPGTQGALFLAVASCIDFGGRVAIVDPDYFANRKIVEFFDATPVYVTLNYQDTSRSAALDLTGLEAAFADGVKLFLFSNPNNPTGVVYTQSDIASIAELANRYEATVIVDQLYSRLLFTGTEYTHLRSTGIDPNRVITTLGPSKTESLSGYRLGAAFGAPELIQRMERLQAIVSLRAAGYNQAALNSWFSEPEGWMQDRTAAHQRIRDGLVTAFTAAGMHVRTTEAGSYVYPQLPELEIPVSDFVTLLRLQAGVIVTPGTEFTPNEDRRVRLNFSQEPEAALAAGQRIIKLAQRYAAK
ncbi:pyridoxal phosphate-dependent aminotransferase [Arthrobacter sp. USHLN218]|uniref:pyridoxal phosphate-dependent aminotransferase n=1 Tax=Arthrobacter sp. USHLN218 TaxID=3081232 RepID=UPI0030198B97